MKRKMWIEIKDMGTRWSVCIYEDGIRGYKGFPFFSSCTDARLGAEGIRFCYLNNKLLIPCNYSDTNPVIHKNNKAFQQGIEIFYTRILNTSKEVFDKVIASMLS